MVDGDRDLRRPRGRHTRAGGPWARLVALERLLRQRRNRAPVCIYIAGLVLAATIGLITLLERSGGHPTALPPTPPSPSATLSIGRSTPSPSAKAKAKTSKPIHCTRPAPTGGGTAPFQICIPALRVDASVMLLGLNKDRTVEVPPLSRVGDAGWYKYSTAPGSIGPTVILGHVDSAQYGPGIFFRLGRLHSGDKVVVSRGDGMIATFHITRVAEVPKSHFPTNAVYGATSQSTIRLVTCGGRFDSASGNYLDNIIAYGTLLNLAHR